MSHYINTLMSKELTCIPRIVDGYLGKFYSNAAGNAITWAFVFWCFLRYCFEFYLEILLRKMRVKTFRRERLTRSLWFCGFYGVGFVYCTATISRNNMNVFEYKKTLSLDGGPVPPHVVLGLGLIGSFFLHSAVWELMKRTKKLDALKHLMFAFIPFMAYQTRRIELFLALLTLTSLSQFIFHGIRCLTASMQTMKSTSLVLKGFLLSSSLIYIFSHVLMILLILIVPLVNSLTKVFTFPVLLLVIALASWWILETYNGPLHKICIHWVYHLSNNPHCGKDLIECILFDDRDDLAYNLRIIRQEIKERENRMLSKRKPKNKGVLVQTLKCMVAIRRKLNKKRTTSENSESSGSSDSDKKAISDEEDSSDVSEDEDSKKGTKEDEEYREETARALMEDEEERQRRVSETDGKKND